MSWRKCQLTSIGRRNIIDAIRFRNFSKLVRPNRMIGINSSGRKPPERRLNRIFRYDFPGVNAWAREKAHPDAGHTVFWITAIVSLLALAYSTAPAQTKITVDHNSGAAINAEFKFKSVPAPARNDAAAQVRV